MNKTTEFLEAISASKTDLLTTDFKVIVRDNVLPITPEMVAEMFACMDSEGQAAFYNHVDTVATSWHATHGQLCMQLQAITDEDGLTLAGRRVMQAIGDYSHWGLTPSADSDFLEAICND